MFDKIINFYSPIVPENCGETDLYPTFLYVDGISWLVYSLCLCLLMRSVG